MALSQFFMPSNNLVGEGALEKGLEELAKLNCNKVFIITDEILEKIGVVDQVAQPLQSKGIEVSIFTDVQPNPTVSNVNAGLEKLKSFDADLIISLGGGSVHDCAKAIALVATNGGKIEDYEGLDQSTKPQLPLVSINTTAGTASEMTRFCIITDENTHVKMAIVDTNVTPTLSINDSGIMSNMPASLTAATGMDALTHAVEAYVSTGASPITDACAVKAIELIATSLPTAVKEPKNMVARENMAYAQFLAGMAFNNASLGYVHAMAHQLGGMYDLPHGVCNALLLPHVEAFNESAATERLNTVGKILSDNNSDLAGLNTIDAIKKLADIVNIPKSLKELGVKREDFDELATNALKDVCGLSNPVQASHEQIVGIFEDAFEARS
ncbi:iron-containing alcohol dehydrogenase [Psychrobacter sp.]|uniref:iron-containing alcohol dehydrogenase n=1 Tax=Psychrobacter sp. TaxID=56811 RepID=UPI0026471FAD|nr:iron-containing alcohol dehydrogenase [Psychrobacter sp.]MDN6276643.1 iron-containing alcohol dehydrogenase [Psychrobacter sp.]MDN6308891.1 iron-containing alcohol dehydrogenase [Psychrobacter sp.]